MAIKVTRRDVLASSVVEPNWYPCVVSKVETKPASTDQSMNFVFTLKFLQEEYKDYFIKQLYLNEKGIFGSGLNFLIACGLPKDAIDKIKNKELDDVEIDERALEGKQIKVKITNTTWNNRVSNEATDFLPLD